MRTLFFKIFGWFWLAMALVAVALILTTWTLPLSSLPGPPHLFFEDAAGVLAETAAVIYDRDGPDGLAAYLHRIQASGHTTAYVLDDDGNALLGDPVPEPVRRFERRFRSMRRPRPDFEGSTVLVGATATLADGRRILLVTRNEGGPLVSLEENILAVSMRLLAVIATAGLVCFALARYLTRPIGKLRRTAARFADGDLSARVGESIGRRQDEIADLARDFDVMAARIEALVESQHTLLRDISHELRSPLARLGVALALARRHAPPEAIESLDRMERESERLNGMIDQLLTIARFEAKEPIDRTERINLPDLVESVVADADFEARASNRRVESTRTDACEMEGSEALMRSAIENVARNAIRYTPESTAVEISLEFEAVTRRARVVVRDHGAGVPDRVLDSVFKPFFRVDADRDRRSGGVGLGLAITERAIRLHGGSVSASNANGGGLVIVLEVPATAVR